MANITFLDPGGSAGAGGYFVTSSDHGSGATITLDTTIKPIGAYSSFQFNSGSSNLHAWFDAGFSGIIGTAGRISFYAYYTTAPTLAMIFEVQSAGNGHMFGVGLAATGGNAHVVFRPASDVGGTTTGTAVLSPNTFYRITLAFNVISADNASAKVYVNGVQDISVTGQYTGNHSTPTDIMYGWTVDSEAGVNNTVNIGGIYIDDGSDLADPANGATDLVVTSKFSGTVNANNFDTVGGTGAVNERPLSETNYMAQVGSSQVSQNYAIQAASAGDINMSSATILGYVGWIWAKQSAVSGTPKLTLNGTDYNITLATSSAIYFKPITSSTYPSNAAGIGMVSGGTTDDTFLYECGVMFAYIPVTPKPPIGIWDGLLNIKGWW